MGRLTDKEKKKIIADYIEIGSYRAVGRMHGVSDKTVRRVVMADAETTQKVAQKKEENTKDVLSFMQSQGEKVCSIVGRYLEALLDDERIAKSNTVQIATALAIVIDKFTTASGGVDNGETGVIMMPEVDDE